MSSSVEYKAIIEVNFSTLSDSKLGAMQMLHSLLDKNNVHLKRIIVAEKEDIEVMTVGDF